MAVVVDILTGVLAGGVYRNLSRRKPPDDENLHFGCSHFFAAMQVALFRPVQEFKAAVDDMLCALKESENAEGHERIYTHGEVEFETEEDKLRNGIPYDAAFLEQLRELGSEFGVQL